MNREFLRQANVHLFQETLYLDCLLPNIFYSEIVSFPYEREVLVEGSCASFLEFTGTEKLFLLDKKFEVYVCADADKLESHLEEIGCKILKFKIDKKGKNFFKELILFLKIFVTFKKVKPDLILNFTIKPVIYSSIASSFLNIPHINTMTGIGIYFFKKN